MLSVKNLTTYFHTRNGIVRAVDDISFDVSNGETLGIVGESGSGKSVACLSLLGLVPSPPGRIENGRAMFDGIDLFKCSSKDIRRIRGNRISIIFQDPITSLNPYLTIGVQLTEPLLAHQNISAKQARIKAIDLLYEVGFQDAKKFMNHYPHVLSGGMSQRVVIAMALITGPELLIADEPTTALDVTIQAQILDLIKSMQKTRNMAVIFITHDLGVIAGIADRVIVMYAGKLMESGKTHDIFYNPAHPYTRALMDSIPASCKPGSKLYAIPGMPPDLLQPISGCSFAPRCKDAEDKCFCTSCRIKEISSDHYSACLKIQNMI